MLESIKPYELIKIQKASPSESDAFDVSYIYSFRTECTDKYQSLRYIIRVERFEDVFAVKFYAKRDHKLDTKYNRIIKAHNYTTALRIFVTCAFVVPELLKDNPTASFAINGARSLDLESDKIEGKQSNQRFRIYKTIALLLFGRQTFEHVQFEEISSYLLVNKKECSNIESKIQHIKELFLSKFDFDL